MISVLSKVLNSLQQQKSQTRTTLTKQITIAKKQDKMTNYFHVLPQNAVYYVSKPIGYTTIPLLSLTHTVLTYTETHTNQIKVFVSAALKIWSGKSLAT